jgi:chromosome segregation ATPase
VQYLAEVKKQNKGFMGGVKAEIKLLACQHNDQTWSAVPGEEMLSCDEIPQAGEGALVIVNLNSNRQLQGKPELAGIELVRQLQKLSRLLEKTKDQQEEIEQWKESLTIQGEALNQRQMEMESQLEQIEQMQDEFQELERQRQEMAQKEEQFRQEQDRLENLQKRIGPVDWNSPQIDKVQEIIAKLFANVDRAATIETQIAEAKSALANPEVFLQSYRQQLEGERSRLQEQQDEVNRQGEAIATQKQELQSLLLSVEANKAKLQGTELLVAGKQELLQRINNEIDASEEFKKILMGTGDTHTKQQIDISALERMPLGELQETLKNLQADFDKLVRFVNDQEEELSMQCQAVLDIEEKLKTASDYERFDLETELADELERKQMLDETLLGQRRRLRERQSILSQHLRVLRRRQGVMEIDDNLQQINIEPILLQLKERKRNAQQERQRLEKELEQMQQGIRELQAEIDRLLSDRAGKTEALQKQEENWESAKVALAQLRSRLEFSEQTLVPLQNQLTHTQQQLESVAQLFVSNVEYDRAIA